MSPLRLSLQLAGALLVASAAAPAAPATAGPAAESAAERRILVMLKMPPSHFRPTYGQGGAYGDSAGLAARRRAARAIARRNGLEVVDNWPMDLLGIDCFVMEVADGGSVEAAIARVSRESMVEWSQPLNTFKSLAAPRGPDPLLRVQPAAAKWRLRDLHRFATGRGVTVAVVDSKVETRHPDLSGQFSADRNFVDDGASAAERHGTGIAGVIAAKAGNGVGIAGIAPGARILALRACRQQRRTALSAGTTCDTLSLAKALHFALDRGAQVINLSLTGPRDRLLQTLIDLALKRRAAVVAAFDAARPDGGFPASQPGVVAVADEALRTVPGSVYRAPGRDVPTTQPGGTWTLVNGSSYAAAHVSGLLALVRERRGPRARLALSRDGRGGPVDACATLFATSPACGCDCATSGPERPSTDR